MDMGKSFLTEAEKANVMGIISDDLITALIDGQINSNEMSEIDTWVFNNARVNVLDDFDSRISYIFSKYKDNKELVDSLIAHKDKVYSDIVQKLEKRFGILVNFKNYEGNVLNKDYYLMIKALYSFFIFNHVNNLLDYIYNYIKVNRETIFKMYKKDTNKKDISYTAARKELGSQEFATLVFNLDEIVDSLTTYMDDPETLLKEIIDATPDDKYSDIVKDMYFKDSHFTLNGDFCKSFFSPIANNDTNLAILSCQVRARLVELSESLPKNNVDEEE